MALTLHLCQCSTKTIFSNDSEYLINAQGEDVVAGIRTPEPISRMKAVLPAAYDQFLDNVEKLENHFGDMQDVGKF